MTNTLQTIIENLEKGNFLELVGETFSNEILFNQDLQCAILGGITFFDVDFRKVDFTGNYFGTCKFENCTFKNTIFSKCEFWKCTFKHCKIFGCNLTKSNSNTSIFTKCKLQEVNFTANDLKYCKFIEPKFENIDLDCMIVVDLKVWKSNQCIEIKDSSNFEKFLRDMNSISTDATVDVE